NPEERKTLAADFFEAIYVRQNPKLLTVSGGTPRQRGAGYISRIEPQKEIASLFTVALAEGRPGMAWPFQLLLSSPDLDEYRVWRRGTSAFDLPGKDELMSTVPAA